MSVNIYFVTNPTPDTLTPQQNYYMSKMVENQAITIFSQNKVIANCTAILNNQTEIIETLNNTLNRCIRNNTRLEIEFNELNTTKCSFKNYQDPQNVAILSKRLNQCNSETCFQWYPMADVLANKVPDVQVYYTRNIKTYTKNKLGTVIDEQKSIWDRSSLKNYYDNICKENDMIYTSERDSNIPFRPYTNIYLIRIKYGCISKNHNDAEEDFTVFTNNFDAFGTPKAINHADTGHKKLFHTFSKYSSSYQHFVSDYLPKILPWLEFLHENEDIKIIVAHLSQTVIDIFEKHLNISRNRLVTQSNEILCANDLFMNHVEPTWFMQCRSITLLKQTAEFIQNLDNDRYQETIVYAERLPNTQRGSLNNNNLIQIVKNHVAAYAPNAKFVVWNYIEPYKWTDPETRDIFSNVTLFVGPHGGSMPNLLFNKADNMTIIEYVSTNYPSWGWSDLATALNADYWWLLVNDQNHRTTNHYVDENVLQKILNECMWTKRRSNDIVAPSPKPMPTPTPIVKTELYSKSRVYGVIDSNKPSGIYLDDWAFVEYGKLHRKILTMQAAPRFLIFHHAGGGLGDIITGITSSLLIAMLTDRALLIDMPSMSWHDWLESPYFNTHIDHNYFMPGSLTRTVHTLDNMYQFIDMFETQDLNQAWNEHIVRISMNQFAIEYLYANPMYHNKIRSWGIDGNEEDPGLVKYRGWAGHLKQICGIYDRLLGNLYRAVAKPVPSFQEKIDLFKQQHFGKNGTLGMHLRFGSDRGDIPSDAPEGTDPQWYWNCAENYRNTADKWFITSDSPSMIQEAIEKEGSRMIYVPGKPKHGWKSDNGPIGHEDMEKIFMDHFILAECDVVMISPSGFSRLAIHRSYYCPHIFCGTCKREVCSNELVPIPRKISL